MDRVLKARDGWAWAGRRIGADRWQAGESAGAILAAARAEASALAREAAAGAAAVRREAEALGRAEGLARGLAEGRAAAAETLVRAAALRDRWLAEVQGEAVELGLDVARRLLGRELRADPGAVRALAVEALAAARGRRRVVLRLHPQAAAALAGAAADGALAAAAAVPSVGLLPDPALDPGDAVVETEAGEVDGRLAARLSAVRAALVGAP